MQNPPPNEPYGYGAPPPPTQAYNAASPFAHLGKSALGNMDANAAGALAYIGVVGLILIIIEKENRFVRFHAMQSLLYGVGMSVVMVILFIFLWVISLVLMMIGAAVGGSAGGGIAAIAGVIAMLIWIAAIALLPLLIMGGLIFGAVKAYQGQMFKLPIVGNFAEKFTK
jgi:uncharacterized membrane protein